ncbi:DUF3422 family protein [Methylocystis parvus]|uniref:DUF3422 domain-containing protein n=1 Tax=Methylocystis parvus TaxID=134 RepID=A0A6B8M743_9HYPH|nr:DUF3422 domain-containing protein [Methylocystis parvus]QGM98318.1 DUF3422 domain-containing protein [Methylocystis parvus]WBK01354.1 DUF3422 domain-containing protein [Methylocystis parvus OBBP]
MNEASAKAHFVEHESRAAILAELHARPFLPLQAPRRIYHFAFATNHEEAAADRAAVAALARLAGVEAPGADAKFHYFDFGDWRLRWEQHTEFTTYTWSTGADAETPFAHPDPTSRGEIEFRPPGRLIVATHLCVVDRAVSLDELSATFNSQSLCVIGVGKEAGHALTDFAVDAFGFTRMAVRILHAPPLETGRLAQRLLEVETYRSMALLGLPLARAVSPDLTTMEEELSEITHTLCMDEQHNNQELLKRLSDLLAANEALSTRTSFRFGASRAYHKLVKSRLELLQETKEGAFPTVSHFLNARLDPAIETCNAVQARQTRFSTDVARTTNLMRTGITLDMERQNGALLDDMVRRTRLQMRLNRMVQGISVAGLAYYLVGLFAFVAKGLKEAGVLPPNLSADMVEALSVPLALLVSWAFMARVRVLSNRAMKEEQVD